MELRIKEMEDELTGLRQAMKILRVNVDRRQVSTEKRQEMAHQMSKAILDCMEQNSIDFCELDIKKRKVYLWCFTRLFQKMYAIAFSLGLLVLVVLERVVNAHIVLLSRLLWRLSDGSSLKGYASTQLVGSGYAFLSSVGSGLVSGFVGLVSSLSTYTVWVFLALLVFGGLFLLQEHYGSLLLGLVDSWNETFGPVVYQVLLIPLQLGNILFTSVIPVYNGILWLAKLLFHNVIIKSAMDNAGTVVEIGKSVADMIKHLFVQVVPACP